MTDESTANGLIAHALECYGRLDILVNNVGGGRVGKIWELKVEDWDHVLRLNLRSTCREIGFTRNASVRMKL